jgi:hypothetical protein
LDVARDQIILERVPHTDIELLAHHLFANVLEAVDDDGADGGAVELSAGLALRLRPQGSRQPNRKSRRENQPRTPMDAGSSLGPRYVHAPSGLQASCHQSAFARRSGRRSAD